MSNLFLGDQQVVQVWKDEAGNGSVSDPVNRAYYSEHSIQYVSSGSETLKVETSLDGSHWVVLDADQDANTIVTYNRHLQWLRFTKGANNTVSVLVGGVATNDR